MSARKVSRQTQMTFTGAPLANQVKLSEIVVSGYKTTSILTEDGRFVNGIAGEIGRYYLRRLEIKTVGITSKGKLPRLHEPFTVLWVSYLICFGFVASVDFRLVHRPLPHQVCWPFPNKVL